MRRYRVAAALWLTLVILGPSRVDAQTVDDLNLQFHGYVTQALIYSTKNNWNTTDSSDGTAAWTEAVANFTAQPAPKLRIGVQARYFRLGNYGNRVNVDWASGEYKINERLGFRAGKVKSPTGLLNETQDIDPAHLWILLPQSIYPLASRDDILSHYGGIVFGTMTFGERLGKLEYRAYGGERVISQHDGYLEPLTAAGLSAPHGLKGRTFGGSLRWRTPLPGLMVGAAEGSEKPTGTLIAGPLTGKLDIQPANYPFIFGRYEHRKLMLAAEYSRIAISAPIVLPGLPVQNNYQDQRSFYAMTSYKVAAKLTAGAYYSSALNRKAAFTNSRYQKDWTVAGRYDFNSFLYLKLEQHFLDGTLIGYSTIDNVNGLAETSRMTFAKLGVSF